MTYYNYVDLNGDGSNEIFAVAVGPYTSGSGGDSGMWLIPYAGMTVSQAFTLIRTPIIVSDTTTNGAHEPILQRSGVSILDSLDILSETINNAALEREFSTIKEKLRSGQGIAEPLSTARYFTPLTINMVAVGEGAGNLETMLEDLAAHYDEEVEYAVGEMTEAIGPILIVVLAAVVGFFALAIFMPMWDMTKLASGGR